MPERKRMTKVVRSLRGGQITIPAEFRRALGITDDSLLKLTLEEGELHIKPVAVTEEKGKGAAWLKDLYQYFAPVREEIEVRGVSEDELNEDIDSAVRAVRQQHG